MARKKSVFAQIQKAAAQQARQAERAKNDRAREHLRLIREQERAVAAAARARDAAGRAEAREAAAAHREAKRLYIDAQKAEAAALTSGIEELVDELESVLHSTLAVDDYVDLAALRQSVEHPPFMSPHLSPTPPPTEIAVPAEPKLELPPEPSGMAAMFGGRKRHEKAVAEAERLFALEHEAWRKAAAEAPARQFEAMRSYQLAETGRLEKLATDQSRYEQECTVREQAVEEANRPLDELIEGLAQGNEASVEEYLAIVLANSAYPEGFDVTEEVTFRAEHGEATIHLSLPDPSLLPKIREYKYVAAKDEITAVARSAKDVRDRYRSFLEQVLLRTLHEVWEADRFGHVKVISLTASVEMIDPALGTPTSRVVAEVAAEREAFEAIDLGLAVPSESLKYLNAVVSRNPSAGETIQRGGARG